MRCDWRIMIAALMLRGPLLGDEPSNRFQIVTPKTDGVSAVAINGHGEIVGFEWVESKKTPGVVEEQPFFARGKTLTRLPLLQGYTATFPAALSDDGTVVGRSSKPAPLGVAVPLRNQAFIWTAAGGIRGLGVLEGDRTSIASDITSNGRRISGFSVGEYRVRACIWERKGNGWKATALPFVSNLGSQVVAMSDDGKHISAVDGEKPVLWTEVADGQWKEEFIGLPGSFVPRGVNNSGTVVGVRFTFDGLTHAVLWSREAGQKQLEKPQGYVRSEALAVNNQGIVVGMVDGPRGSKTGPNAFVHEQGRLRLLDEGGPTFASAQAINDHRQVTGVFEKEEEDEHPAAPGKAKQHEK
ncbi:MAG: HAF repeat-containing protein [Isosphaeraceae bacterium]